MEIEKQKEFLEVLGAIDGQLSAIEVTIENLEKEKAKLKADRIDTLAKCQHVDEDGKPALSGGTLYVWCQICGKLISEEEEKELEKLEE